MSIISNAVYSPDTINIGGEFMTVLLIISLITTLLLSSTKHWDRYISNMFDISSDPLLLTFVVIVILKVMLII